MLAWQSRVGSHDHPAVRGSIPGLNPGFRGISQVQIRSLSKVGAVPTAPEVLPFPPLAFLID